MRDICFLGRIFVAKGETAVEKEQLIQKVMMEIHDEYTKAEHRCGSLPMTDELNLRIAEDTTFSADSPRSLLYELYFPALLYSHTIPSSCIMRQTFLRLTLPPINRQFDVKTPDTVWGTDVTEFKTASGQKSYLSIVRDFCTGEIVGHSCSTSPSLKLVMESLEKALSSWGIKAGRQPM